jgi:hypothetical protein
MLERPGVTAVTAVTGFSTYPLSSFTQSFVGAASNFLCNPAVRHPIKRHPIKFGYSGYCGYRRGA